MAITRYAGDRFVGDVNTTTNLNSQVTGVLDGAFYTSTGNLKNFVKRAAGWAQLAGGGGGSTDPAGADNQVQFNDDGVFGATAGLTFDGQRLYANNFQLSGILYDSNASVGEGGMVLANEGTTGVHWKNIESVLSGVGGSGVANYGARWSDEDTLTSGTIYDDGDVGIGTDNPGYKLDVSGDGRLVSPIPLSLERPTYEPVHFGFTSDGSDHHMYLKATSAAATYQLTQLRFGVSTADTLIITDNGRVGIGTDGPNELLEIFSTGSNTNAKIRLSSAGNNTGGRGIEFFDGAYNRWRIATVGANGNFEIHRSTTGNSWEAVPAISIDKADGYVGIGTTDPSTKLYVLENDANWAAIIKNTNANGYGLSIDCIGNTGTTVYALGVYTGAGTGFFVRNKGNCGIGTTAPGAAKLDIYHDGGFTNDLPTARIYHRNYPDSGNARVAALDVDVGVSNGDLFHHGYVQLFQHFTGAAYNSPRLYFSSNSYSSSTNHRQWWGIQALADTTATGDRLAFTCDLSSTNPTATPVHIMSLQTDGNVGIGVTAPDYKLEVQGSVTGDWLSRIYNTATTGNHSGLLVRIDNPSSTGIILGANANGTYRFVVKPDGHVGIGTNAPWTRFTVSGGTTAEADDFIPMSVSPSVVGGNSAGILFGVYPLVGYAKQGIFWERYVGNGGYGGRGKLHFVNRDAVDDSVPTIADSKMTILEDGNVGIGTTSPSTLLHIDDDTNAAGLTIKGAGAGYANAGVRLRATNGTNARALGVFMHDAGGDTEWFAGRPYAASDQYIIGRKASLATPDYETAITGNALFTVKNDGKVGIGTTTPDAELQVMNNDSSSYRFGYGGTSDVYFDADDVYFRSDNGGANDITKKGGSLGIGVVNAEHKLHVAGDAIISGVLYDSNNSSGVAGHVFTSEAGGPQWKMIEDVLSGVGGNGTANYVPKWTDSDTIGDSVIAESGGNIGIGTVTPEQLFEISATGDAAIQFQSTKASLVGDDPIGSIIFKNNDSSGTDPHICGKIASIAETIYGRAGLAFSTGRTSEFAERMRIRWDGHVGIGTNSPNVANAAAGNTVLTIKNQTNPYAGIIEFICGATSSNGNSLGVLRFLDGSSENAQIEVARESATDDAWMAFKTKKTGGSLTTHLFIASDGNVGIGTAVPGSNTLYVNGNCRAAELDLPSGGVLDWANGDARIVEGEQSNYSLSFKTYDGTSAVPTRMFIRGGTTDNLVGIGTDNPLTPLHIYTNSASAQEIFFDNDGAGEVGITFRTDRNTDGNLANFIRFDAADDGGNNTRYSTIESFIVDNTDTTEEGRLTFSTMVGGTDTETMHIVGGKVGIGIDAPDSKLEIAGGGYNSSLKIKSSGADSGIQFEDSAGNTDGYIYANGDSIGFLDSGTNYTIQCKNDDYIKFSTNGDTEHMRIQSDGNVGIGTTAAGYRFEVRESSATWLSRIYNTGTGNGLLVRVDSGSSDAILSTHNGTNHLFVVKGDGNVGIGTYTPTTLFESNVNSASVGTDSVTARNTGVTTIGHSVGYRYQFNTAVPAASRAILEHTNSGRGRLGFFVSTDGAVGNLTEYLSIKSDGVVDINSAKLKINGASGTDGQVLTTDGAGGIAWETNGSGTVTSVGINGGTGLDVTNSPITTSGNITVSLDLNELGQAGVLAGSDCLVVVDGTDTKKETISGINLTIFNNDAGWTNNAGTVTSVTAGVGLTMSAGSSTVNPTLATKLDELTNMTAAVVGGTDQLILLDNGDDRRKTINTIDLGQFNNDQGWTSNAGTVTSVTAGTGMTQTGSATGATTLNVGGGVGIDANASNISLNLSELTSTNAPVTADKMVFIDNGANASFEFSDVPLSIFSNDVGWITSTVTSPLTVTKSSGLAALTLRSNPANQVADIGGELIFQATYRATSDTTQVARIKGTRENATTNNWAGRLTFHTSPGGDSPSASTEQMRIQSDGNVGIGTNNPGQLLEVGNDGNSDYALIGPTKIGGGMGHGDYAGFSHRSMGGTSNYCLLQYSDGNTYLNAASGKTIHLRVNNSNILKVNDGNVNIVSGNLQMGGTNIINSGRAMYNLESFKLADSKIAYFGTGNDLQIYHSGTHSYIKEAGNGALKIWGDDVRIENASERNVFKAIGTAVELYFDNGSATSKKLETTSTGVSVTGGVVATSFSGNGASVTNLNALNITAGTVATARLGTGTADSSTFLRGDNTWVANANGTVTSVTAGVGLTISAGSSTVNPTLATKLDELTDMTAAVVGGTDQLILLDNGDDRRKTINTINLGQFNNDQGWTNNAGTVTGTGTANSISKWTGTSSQGNSTISDNGSIVTVANDVHIYEAGSDKKLWLSEGTSGSGATNVQLSPNGVSYLRGGSVGIGTAIPGAKLHVYGGNIRISSTDDKPQLEFFETAAARWVIGHSNSPNNYFAISEGSDIAASERLVIAPSTGSVGIGTEGPSTLLHVYNNTASTAAELKIENATANLNAALMIKTTVSDWDVGSNINAAAGSFEVYERTSGSAGSRLTILSGGKVGIGTNSPATKLTVHQSADDNGLRIYGYDDVAARYAELFVNSAGYTVLDASTDRGLVLKGHGIDFYVNSGGTHIGRWTFGGNLGIGTTSPDGTLHVETGSAGTITAEAYADDLIIENSDHVGISLRCPDAKDGFILFQSATNDRVARISAEYNGGDENLAFAVDDDDKMVINDSGNVGIGTDDPSALLEVYKATVADSASELLKVVGTNDAQLRVEGANDNTSVGYGTNRSGGALMLRNTNSTVGNYESICFSNADNYVNAGIHAINVAHGVGGATRGRLEFWTRNTGNNYHKALEISDSSAVTFHTSTGAVAYTLPNSDGNAGYHLETNGSGTVTWAAGGAGTVTSITAGDGLSGGTITTSGTIANTDKGSSQNIFKKVRTSNSIGNQIGLSTANSNDDTIDFRQGTGITLATSGDVVTITAANNGTVTGTGTDNYIPKWNGTSALENSLMHDDAWGIYITKSSALAPLVLVSNPANQVADIGGEIIFEATYRPTSDTTPVARIKGSRESATVNNWAGKLTFHTSPGGDTPSASTEQMRIQSDGNVGIGTNDPQKTFDVNGTSYFRNNTFHVDGVKAVFGAGDDLQIYHDAVNSHGRITNATGQLWLQSDTGIRLTNLAVTKSKAAFYDLAVELYYDGAKKLETTSSGVTVTGTLTETSSITLKENVETYTPSLDIINKIRPVRYNRKTNKDKKEIGLVAEELAELFPELVERDNNGDPSSVNYSRAVAVLLHGFKELYKEVKELKEKI